MQLQASQLLTLQVLKQCRTNMVQDFLKEEPSIYKPSYQYETSPALFKLAQEQYFLTWLSKHWQELQKEKVSLTIEEQTNAEKNFATVFLKLLNKWEIIKSDDAYQVNMGLQLIENMQLTLNKFIETGNKSEENRNQLELILEKNKVLFDREFERLTHLNSIK